MLIVFHLQAELRSPPRPWSDFFARFSVPKNTTKAVSRLKCNLFYYRCVAALVTVSPTLAVCTVLRTAVSSHSHGHDKGRCMVALAAVGSCPSM